LQVSPINARTKIQLLIRQEIQNAKEGLKAEITLKINNLVDRLLIDELYRASQGGVKVKAIVRGMCSLRPGIKELSENISIISVVDRFLEHPRVMIFENAGDKRVFISSADWMARNMDTNLLAIQFRDTVKARVIDKEQTNKYVRRGNRRSLRSQIETYHFLKALEED
jgi:polyphosphate kinase